MRHAAVPDNKIAWVCAHLLPLHSMVREPLHPLLSETEPFWCPGGDAWLIGHLAVELLGNRVPAWADYETAVGWAAGVEVHKALEACLR